MWTEEPLRAEYSTLLRFLRARDYDIPKTSTMYLHHLQWRRENGVDTILEDFTFTERTPYLQVYPQGYFNTDKLGRPITIQHLGKIEPKRIKEITTTERMLKYHIQEYERFLKHIAPVCSKLQGRHIDQTFAILDVKGAFQIARSVLSYPATSIVPDCVSRNLCPFMSSLWTDGLS